jgi:hypothetical protein
MSIIDFACGGISLFLLANLCQKEKWKMKNEKSEVI